jgi:hypothetical protein
MKTCSPSRKKDGNETVRPPKAQPRAASKPTRRLKTAGLLGRLHPEPPSPAEPTVTQVPIAENLTALYREMCALPCPPEVCAAAGVALGSTWGQALVAQHIKAAAAGDGAAITAIMNRVEGRTPDALINFSNVALKEEQLLALLGNIKQKPDTLALFVRLLAEEHIQPVPVFTVTFITPELEKPSNDFEPQNALPPLLDGDELPDLEETQ